MRSQTPKIPAKPRRNLVPRRRNSRNYRRLLYRLGQGQQVS
ncbi:30S ribosomal protein S30e [Vulcanisaeta souniana]|nr:30S ribosomal protein S30e [Vulcanisaeta souniana]